MVELTDRRSVEQNDLMWRLLRDISTQLKWTVNGSLDYLSPDDWKDILTAGITKHQRVAQGIEGGWVLLGQRTHKMNKTEMAEFIEYIYAFGATRNPQIIWTDPK